jgi:hypothetical protein
VSAIGAATSLCYCTIALILGCIYASNQYGSVGGLAGSSTADKVFGVLNALGSLGFAYSFAQASGQCGSVLLRQSGGGRACQLYLPGGRAVSRLGDTACCSAASCMAGLQTVRPLPAAALPCGASLQVLLEIQDTLKQPPQAAKTMKKAMSVAITGAFAFYLSVAVTGYSALGLNEQTMPAEVLEGFTGG